MSVLKYSCGCKFIIEDGKEEEIFCKNPITDIPKGKLNLIFIMFLWIVLLLGNYLQMDIMLDYFNLKNPLVNNG